MKKQRTTQQRKVIEEICFSSTCPLSIDDIESRGKEILATLNRVTVYRNLNRMVDAGELTRASPAGVAAKGFKVIPIDAC